MCFDRRYIIEFAMGSICVWNPCRKHALEGTSLCELHSIPAKRGVICKDPLCMETAKQNWLCEAHWKKLYCKVQGCVKTIHAKHRCHKHWKKVIWEKIPTESYTPRHKCILPWCKNKSVKFKNERSMYCLLHQLQTEGKMRCKFENCRQVISSIDGLKYGCCDDHLQVCGFDIPQQCCRNHCFDDAYKGKLCMDHFKRNNYRGLCSVYGCTKRNVKFEKCHKHQVKCIGCQEWLDEKSGKTECDFCGKLGEMVKKMEEGDGGLELEWDYLDDSFFNLL